MSLMPRCRRTHRHSVDWAAITTSSAAAEAEQALATFAAADARQAAATAKAWLQVVEAQQGDMDASPEARAEAVAKVEGIARASSVAMVAAAAPSSWPTPSLPERSTPG